MFGKQARKMLLPCVSLNLVLPDRQQGVPVFLWCTLSHLFLSDSASCSWLGFNRMIAGAIKSGWEQELVSV